MGVSATKFTAAIMNDIQENIAQAVEFAGLTLAKLSYTQLRQAIQVIADSRALLVGGACRGRAICNNSASPALSTQNRNIASVSLQGGNRRMRFTYTANMASSDYLAIPAFHNPLAFAVTGQVGPRIYAQTASYVEVDFDNEFGLDLTASAMVGFGMSVVVFGALA